MASPAPAPLDAVGGLDRDGFVSKLIDESTRLQNDHRPQEGLVALRPTGSGPLVVRKVIYAEGRSNVIVDCPGTVHGRVISYVGMHISTWTSSRPTPTSG
ncbi:acetylornithine deacetylase [Panicum miliaceum]|uniref:Acetylornithine deacetylase n=1 Tax=Panicum miliaceum TaxID=4540 RepID=A0A3L6RQ01_PANMI|nr:acetylornithine deacetylase [Panicum miliaceum]